MKLLQQPQKGQSEVLKSGGHKGTPWELPWSCRSTLLHSSNLVLVRPPSPGTQQKIDAQLKRQDGHFTRSLEQKQQRDLHSFLSSCLWCLHSFITTSLSLPILNPLTVRGLNVASSWFKNDAAWLSPPISGGTKGILNPSKFQKKLVPNQTANPHQMLKGHLCLLPDRRHLGAESQTPWKQTQTSEGFHQTHHPAYLWECTCSLAPGSKRYSGAILWTSALTATVRFSSSLWLLSLGNMLVGFPSSTFLKYQEGPFQVGYFSKSFRSLRQTTPCHTIQNLSSWHINSWPPSLHFRYPCINGLMKIVAYI